METKKREEIEALGKVVSVTKPAEKKEEQKQELTTTQLVEGNNVKPKKRISMKKTTKNTEPRVLKFLATRKPTRTRIIAKALGMNKEVNENDYKLLANLLLRMHRQGLIKKFKTGTYYVPNEKTKNLVAKQPKKSTDVNMEQRMANLREAKRLKKINGETEVDVKPYDKNNPYDKMENLLRLRKQSGKPQSFYDRVEKEIFRLMSGTVVKPQIQNDSPLKVLENGKVINTSQRLSGFRLIKNYPNSPYTIGTVITGSKDLFNYPEFWQPQYQAVEQAPQNDVLHNNSFIEALEYLQAGVELLKKATAF